MQIQKTSHGATGGVTCNEKGVRQAARVFFDESAEAGRNRTNHFASNIQKARMAAVRGIVKEASRCHWRCIDIDGPVHETLCTSDGEDNRVQIVYRQRLDDHSLGAL